MCKSTVDYEKIAGRFKLALRQYKDANGLSIKSLSQAIGNDHRTVESHLSGGLPSFEHLFAYISYFGPEFLNEIMEPIGITGAFREDGTDISATVLIKHSAHFTHLLAKSYEDGFIDHIEREALRKAARPLVSLLSKGIVGNVK